MKSIQAQVFTPALRASAGTVAIAILLAAAVCSSVAFAQSDPGKVFNEATLDEAELIRALTPPPPGVRGRSIRVQPAGGGGGGRRQPPVASTTPGSGGAASVLITFETDSSDLTPQSKSQLDVVARALGSDKLSSFTFAIEGHADPRGGPDYNMKLSQDRADNVVDYLVTAHHIPRERLKAIGRGDQELLRPDLPIAPENRRVTFKTQVE